MVIAAKARALLEGRYNVAFEDLTTVAKPALRHRIFLQYEAEAEKLTADHLVDLLVERISKEPGRI
jgi:MoxR-like ATPase